MTQAYALQAWWQSNNPQFGQTDICQVLDWFQSGRRAWRCLLFVPSQLYEGLYKLIEAGYQLLSNLHRRELKENRVEISTISYSNYTI